MNLKNTFYTLYLWSWRIHVKSVVSLKKIIVVTYSLMSWLRALLDLRIYGSVTWRSELRSTLGIGRVLAQTQAPGNLGVKQVSNTVIKMVLVMLPLNSGPKLAVKQWIPWWSGWPGGSNSRRKLCILPYHSCHIYRTWKSV